MKRISKYDVAVALALALISWPSQASVPTQRDESPWIELGTEDGIRVFRQETPGTRLVAFRGEAEVRADIPKLAQVLSDSTRKTEWMASLAEAKTVSQSNLLDRIEYNHTSVPWPFQDREFFFRAQIEINREARTFTARMRSIDEAQIPANEQKASGLVRGTLESSVIQLRELAPDEAGRPRSLVTVEIRADPKGNVPKWLVNLFQRDWPRKTLLGIQRQVAKADVGEEPEVRAFMEGKYGADPIATPEKLLEYLNNTAKTAKLTR